MKKDKKLKLGKLKFYIIDDEYIEFLRRYDKHIAYNKNEKRPYIGVVFTIQEHYYFAPLFSPKQKHKTYKNNFTFFKIINNKTKSDLGIIRFSNMIPVPEKSIYLLDMKNKSYAYKRLLSEQYSHINMTKNKKEILKRAEKLYNIVTKSNKNKLYTKNVTQM